MLFSAPDLLLFLLFGFVSNVCLFKVHITQGDHLGKAVIVSWITMAEPGSNTVVYWSENSNIKLEEEGSVVTYKYYNYASGYIHHCTIRHLEVGFSTIF